MTYQDNFDDLMDYIWDCDYYNNDDEVLDDIDYYVNRRIDSMKRNYAYPFCYYYTNDCQYFNASDYYNETDSVYYTHLDDTFWNEVEEFIANVTREYNDTGLVDEH